MPACSPRRRLGGPARAAPSANPGQAALEPGAIASLTACQAQLTGPILRVVTQMQLATEATPRAAERLRPVFLSAPAACWFARPVVESTSNSCRLLSSCKPAKTLVHTPLFFQREKRVNTVDQAPKRSGKSRQDTPQRRRHRTASINKWVLAAVTPRVWASA